MILRDRTPQSSSWGRRLGFGLLGALCFTVAVDAPPAQAQQSGIKKIVAAILGVKDPARSSWTGSIKVPGKLKKAERATLAKITHDDAQEAALAAVAGKTGRVKDIELKVTNGFLVYVVDVATGEGKEIEVIVDAGNGKVLYPAADPLAITRIGDQFTATYQTESMTITLTGTVSDGQTRVAEIAVQDGELTRKFNDIARIPEPLRAKVMSVVESVEKRNRAQ